MLQNFCNKKTRNLDSSAQITWEAMGWIVTITAIQVDIKLTTTTVAVEVKRREWVQVMLKSENTQELMMLCWAGQACRMETEGSLFNSLWYSGLDNWKEECHSLRWEHRFHILPLGFVCVCVYGGGGLRMELWDGIWYGTWHIYLSESQMEMFD